VVIRHKYSNENINTIIHSIQFNNVIVNGDKFGKVLIEKVIIEITIKP
jgi:hypothetical protein